MMGHRGVGQEPLARSTNCTCAQEWRDSGSARTPRRGRPPKDPGPARGEPPDALASSRARVAAAPESIARIRLRARARARAERRFVHVHRRTVAERVARARGPAGEALAVPASLRTFAEPPRGRSVMRCRARARRLGEEVDDGRLALPRAHPLADLRACPRGCAPEAACRSARCRIASGRAAQPADERAPLSTARPPPKQFISLRTLALAAAQTRARGSAARTWACRRTRRPRRASPCRSPTSGRAVRARASRRVDAGTCTPE